MEFIYSLYYLYKNIIKFNLNYNSNNYTIMYLNYK